MSDDRAPLLRVSSVWLILTSASIAGFLLAEGLAPPRIAASIAVLLAGLKVHLVFGQYMEVGWHHGPIRVLLQLWLFAVIAILLAGYWLA
jgi:hypothetical protein